MLAHLDVVPAGNGWRYPPFGGVLADGKIYGRGTMDDKGPAVICLYCLKALKERGILPKRKIKLIVGCNEESGWKCMEHYKKVASLPKEGFTPDADFPVIYAEKGILQLRLAFPLTAPPFEQLYGGSAANMVCDFAYAYPYPATKNFNRFQKNMFGVVFQAENGGITARGVAAHASTPEKGVNAFGALLAYYAQMHEGCRDVYNILFENKLQLKNIQDQTGVLTLSPNVVRFEKGVLYVTADFRVPATHALNEVTHALDKANIAYEILHEQPALFNRPDGKLIQTLLSVYNRVTGKNSAPVAIGGGTYARVLQCGCGFGPQEEDEECTIHQANEYISLQKIKRLSEIYYHALAEIVK